jgi:hypothetical protein
MIAKMQDESGRVGLVTSKTNPNTGRIGTPRPGYNEQISSVWTSSHSIYSLRSTISMSKKERIPPISLDICRRGRR